MQQSKLITVLRTLSNKEMRNFKRFLESPWFNSHEERTLLYDIIIKQAPHFHGTGITKEVLFKKLYKGEAFDAARLHRRASELYKLLEQFLVQTELEASNIQQELLFLRACRSRKLDSHFSKTVSLLEKKIESKQNRDWSHYLNLFTVYYLDYTHPKTEKLQTTIASLQKSMDNLDLFFAAAKLKLACEMRNRERILNNKYKIHFLEEVMDLIETPTFEGNPIFNIYSSFIRSFMDINSVPFDELRDLFMNNHNLFSPKERIDYFTFLINAYSFAHQSGAADVRLKQFELYKMALKRDLLLDEGILNPQFFNHIVLLGSYLRKIDWTIDFVERYSALLPESDRENQKHMGLAELYFMAEDYDKAWDHLMKVALKDISYKIRVKALEICLTYEYKQFDVLNNKLDAYNMFLRRDNQLAEPILHRNQDFIKFVSQLRRLTLRPVLEKDTTEGKALEEKIKATKNVIFQRWLLAKVKAFT